MLLSNDRFAGLWRLCSLFSRSRMLCRALRNVEPSASKIHRSNCCLSHPLQTTFLEKKSHDCAKCGTNGFCDIVRLSAVQPHKQDSKSSDQLKFCFHPAWKRCLQLSFSAIPFLAFAPCYIWVHNHNDVGNGSKMRFFFFSTKSPKKRKKRRRQLWEPNKLN